MWLSSYAAGRQNKLNDFFPLSYYLSSRDFVNLRVYVSETSALQFNVISATNIVTNVSSIIVREYVNHNYNKSNKDFSATRPAEHPTTSLYLTDRNLQI